MPKRSTREHEARTAVEVGAAQHVLEAQVALLRTGKCVLERDGFQQEIVGHERSTPACATAGCRTGGGVSAAAKVAKLPLRLERSFVILVRRSRGDNRRRA